MFIKTLIVLGGFVFGLTDSLQANFAAFQTHGSSGYQTGQVKPNGAPSAINLSDPQLSGVLFYGLDEGNRTIADLTSNVSMVPQNTVPSVSTTAYGTAIQWPAGSFVSPNSVGYIGVATAAIITAQNLSNQGTGAGWTFATAYYQLGAASFGLVGGRVAKAEENQPYCNWCVVIENGRPAHQLDGFFNNNGTVGDLGPYDPGAYNIFVTVVITAVNTAPGVSTVTLYVNGVQQSQLTGQTVTSSDTGDENQIMFGSIFHIDTGDSGGGCNCYNYEQLFLSTVWNSTQITNFNNNPYFALKW